MPTYTNPKTGKKIKTEKPLNEEQLNEAFSITGGGDDIPLPKSENSLPQDILEGAGLDPIAHPDTIPHVAMGVINAAVNPIGTSLDTIKGLYDEGSSRFGKYFDDVGKSDSGYENALMAGQAAMAPIPFWGNAMENADKAISEGDRHAAGRLGGNVLAAVAPKMGEAKAEIAASKPYQYAMAGIDRFSPMMSAAFKSPLGTGLATGVGSYMFGSNPSTALYHGTMAALGKEGVGRLGSIMGQVKGIRTAAREASAATKITESQLAHMTEEGLNAPKIKPSTFKPVEEDLIDRARKYELEKKAASKAKTPKSERPLTNDEKFMEKLENLPETGKKIEGKGVTPPNPPSRLDSLDPIPQEAPPTPDIPASKLGEKPLDKDILRKYVSEQEADQMLKTIEDRKLLPDTHEEWKAVNKLEEAGVDRMEAMKIVRAKKLEAAKMNNAPLNSRADETNPRALGTSVRDRNVNPRALKNKRKEL